MIRTVRKSLTVLEVLLVAVIATAFNEAAAAYPRDPCSLKKHFYAGGSGLSKYSAETNRLKAVTVMYKRESGYDSDNQDWFWAKYTPDGGLHIKEAQGMKIKLAGRVAKGKPEGCISCHRAAGGGDYVYASNITVK